MPDPLIATPAEGSVPAAEPTVPSGSPVTEPTPQGGVQPQPLPAGTVEPAVTTPQSAARARPQGSEYVRQRMEINNLRRQMSDMQRIIEAQNARTSAPAPSTPQPPAVDYNKMVWDKPVEVMNELIKQALEKSVPNILDQRMSEERVMTSRKDALELIFKNEQISKDGDEGYERIVKIIRDNGLDDLAKSRPLEAANAALKIYKAEYPAVATPKPTTLLAPKPGQMGSVQTGNAAPSTNKEPTVNEIQDKLRALREKVIANPEMAKDDAFKAEIASYAKQLQEMAQKAS